MRAERTRARSRIHERGHQATRSIFVIPSVFGITDAVRWHARVRILISPTIFGRMETLDTMWIVRGGVN